MLQAEKRLLDSAQKSDGRQGFLFAANVAHPKSRGIIRLRSNDPFDHPLIDPKYFEDPYDIEMSLKGECFSLVCFFIEIKMIATNTVTWLNKKNQI